MSSPGQISFFFHSFNHVFIEHLHWAPKPTAMHTRSQKDKHEGAVLSLEELTILCNKPSQSNVANVQMKARRNAMRTERVLYIDGHQAKYDVWKEFWNNGTSLAVQWLRFQLPMQGVQVQSLVKKLRSHMHACLVMCDSFSTPWTVAHQAPLNLWDSPGKNTGVGSHFLLQGIFPIRR